MNRQYTEEEKNAIRSKLLTFVGFGICKWLLIGPGLLFTMSMFWTETNYLVFGIVLLSSALFFWILQIFFALEIGKISTDDQSDFILLWITLIPIIPFMECAYAGHESASIFAINDGLRRDQVNAAAIKQAERDGNQIVDYKK